MHFNVKHSLLAIPDAKLIKTDKNCVVSASSFRQAYVLDNHSIPDTTRKVCYGKNRKENVSLLRTMEVLDEEADISMRRHRDEKSNIQQIVHHLNFQREGKMKELLKRTFSPHFYHIFYSNMQIYVGFLVHG